MNPVLLALSASYSGAAGIALLALSLLWLFWLLFPLVMNGLAVFKSVRWPIPKVKPGHLACIITAYKDIDAALPLVESLLHQQHGSYRVYLVADDCSNPGTEWYDVLHDPRFTLFRPEQPLGSKVRSLKYARDRFLSTHDAIVVFDPDNLATPDFLIKLDEVLRAGFFAVQGRRAAKNLDSSIAVADATGELYKNFIEREVPTRLGSSATIAGSGMAVNTLVFDAYLASPRIAKPLAKGQVIPAEDKILQNFLVGQGLRIPFRWDAVLYDEKVETAAQVERQRTRWTYSYFENIRFALITLLRGLTRADWNALLFGCYTLIPPVFLLGLGAAILVFVNLWFNPAMSFALLMGGMLYVGNIAWSLYLAKAPAVVWQTLSGLPLFAWNQLRSLLRLGSAKEDFLVTEKRRAMRLKDVEAEGNVEATGQQHDASDRESSTEKAGEAVPDGPKEFGPKRRV
ncbi:MAG: glycosyltransferase [Bacteroidetes bacterium]|nr:glycosyltransferase [Bacteroidota bacterium]